MKKENMGVRDTINERGSGLSESRVTVEWGRAGIHTLKPMTEEQKQMLLATVKRKASKGNCFHLHTFPNETRFLIRTLDNVHIHMFAENFDNTGKDWLIIAADEPTARFEANRV